MVDFVGYINLHQRNGTYNTLLLWLLHSTFVAMMLKLNVEPLPAYESHAINSEISVILYADL